MKSHRRQAGSTFPSRRESSPCLKDRVANNNVSRVQNYEADEVKAGVSKGHMPHT